MKNKEKKYLTELTLAVSTFLHDLDNFPNSIYAVDCEVKVANIATWLELHNHAAMRYGLGYSFTKIREVSKHQHYQRLTKRTIVMCEYIDRVGGCCKTVGHKPCKCKEQIISLKKEPC